MAASFSATSAEAGTNPPSHRLTMGWEIPSSSASLICEYPARRRIRMFSLVERVMSLSYTQTYSFGNTPTHYLRSHNEKIMGLRENLRTLMEKNGENPNSLSKKTGVTQPTIFRILEGTSKDPRRSNIEKLARFFGTTVESLYGKNLTPSVNETMADYSVAPLPVACDKPSNRYDLFSPAILEVIQLMESLPHEQQREVVGAVKMMLSAPGHSSDRAAS